MRLGCNCGLAANKSGGRSLSEAEPRSSDRDLGLGGDEGPTFKMVCGDVFGFVGPDATTGEFRGVSRGFASKERVGFTVGAIVGFEGVAFLAAEVCRAGNCSKLVSVCVKLRTATCHIGGLLTWMPQLRPA